MKLKNKKTGEIHEITEVMSLSKLEKRIVLYSETDKCNYKYTSLAELNEEWEDYEEPKTFWFIDEEGIIRNTTDENWPEESVVAAKSIGDYFGTREEAEQAVEKLKAWTRLKDKGFRFTLTPGVGSLDVIPGKFQIEINADMPAKWFCCDAVQEDLDTCFGGEE